MNSTEAIVAIYDCGSNLFTLTISCKSSSTLNNTVNLGCVIDTCKLIEGQSTFGHLLLIVLREPSSIDSLMSAIIGGKVHTERCEELLIALLLHLHLRQDEAELSELRLALLLD